MESLKIRRLGIDRQETDLFERVWNAVAQEALRKRSCVVSAETGEVRHTLPGGIEASLRTEEGELRSYFLKAANLLDARCDARFDGSLGAVEFQRGGNRALNQLAWRMNLKVFF